MGSFGTNKEGYPRRRFPRSKRLALLLSNLMLAACSTVEPITSGVSVGLPPTVTSVDAHIGAANSESNPTPILEPTIVVEPEQKPVDPPQLPTATPSPEPSPTPEPQGFLEVSPVTDPELVQQLIAKLINVAAPNSTQTTNVAEQETPFSLGEQLYQLPSGATIVLSPATLQQIQSQTADQSTPVSEAVQEWIQSSPLATAAKALTEYNKTNGAEYFVAVRSDSSVFITQFGRPIKIGYEEYAGIVFVNTDGGKYETDIPVVPPKGWLIPTGLRIDEHGTFDQSGQLPKQIPEQHWSVGAEVDAAVALNPPRTNGNMDRLFRWRWVSEGETVAIVNDDFVVARLDPTSNTWDQVDFELRNQQAPAEWWQLDGANEDDRAIIQQGLEQYLGHVEIVGCEDDVCLQQIESAIMDMQYISPHSIDPATPDSVYPTWLQRILQANPEFARPFENPLLTLRGITKIEIDQIDPTRADMVNLRVFLNEVWTQGWFPEPETVTNSAKQVNTAAVLAKEGAANFLYLNYLQTVGVELFGVDTFFDIISMDLMAATLNDVSQNKDVSESDRSKLIELEQRIIAFIEDAANKSGWKTGASNIPALPR